MTLSRAQTEVRIEKVSAIDAFELTIGGSPASDNDRKKIFEHLKRIEAYFGEEFPEGAGPLRIESKNNFPASAGIASSASSFCAMTIGFCAAICGKDYTRNLMTHQPGVVSMLARRGSGSAARSVCGGYMYWNSTHAESIKSDWQLLDTIVILSTAAKDISSSEGHRRALTSPHFGERQTKLPQRTALMLRALESKDFHTLGCTLEEEALEMHVIAETSVPPIHYLSLEARRLIAAIQALAQRDFYFTIDAGPNLHLISQRPIHDTVRDLINSLGLTAEIWEDGLGTGPSLE